MNINVVLYENFTALDVFGPIEVFSRVEEYNINYYSLHGGIIRNGQAIQIDTDPMESIEANGILLIPGGFGSRLMASDGE